MSNTKWGRVFGNAAGGQDLERLLARGREISDLCSLSGTKHTFRKGLAFEPSYKVTFQAGRLALQFSRKSQSLPLFTDSRAFSRGKEMIADWGNDCYFSPADRSTVSGETIRQFTAESCEIEPSRVLVLMESWGCFISSALNHKWLFLLVFSSSL